MNLKHVNKVSSIINVVLWCVKPNRSILWISFRRPDFSLSQEHFKRVWFALCKKSNCIFNLITRSFVAFIAFTFLPATAYSTFKITLSSRYVFLLLCIISKYLHIKCSEYTGLLNMLLQETTSQQRKIKRLYVNSILCESIWTFKLYVNCLELIATAETFITLFSSLS